MATTTGTRLGGYVAAQHGADCREKMIRLKIFVAVQQTLEAIAKIDVDARLLCKWPQPPLRGLGLGE
jgi:hypothetical protein